MTTGLGIFDDFPRTLLAHAPTPIEKMENLTAALGGPTLWVKRDDCTAPVMSTVSAPWANASPK